jgi:hypothetical protein
MGRTTRVRRPANREPTSLAVAIATTSENEAIDTIEILVLEANIDPALRTYEIDHPPPPPPLTYETDHPLPSYFFDDDI